MVVVPKRGATLDNQNPVTCGDRDEGPELKGRILFYYRLPTHQPQRTALSDDMGQRTYQTEKIIATKGVDFRQILLFRKMAMTQPKATRIGITR